jgi:hypothetical protein
VSERQWGTVREDYRADGYAWDYLPHDHARSQAYRWGDDGLAGFRDNFHGDNGAAIGAFHQTGWTGLTADVILRRHGEVRAIGDVLRDIAAMGAQQ